MSELLLACFVLLTLITDCLLLTCLLLTPYYSLTPYYYSLLTPHSSLRTPYYSPLTTHSLLLTDSTPHYYSLLTTDPLLLAPCYSLLTTHPLLLTPYLQRRTRQVLRLLPRCLVGQMQSNPCSVPGGAGPGPRAACLLRGPRYAALRLALGPSYHVSGCPELFASLGQSQASLSPIKPTSAN